MAEFQNTIDLRGNPGGFLDQRDVTPSGHIIIDASIRRELEEETGVAESDVERVPGYVRRHEGGSGPGQNLRHDRDGAHHGVFEGYVKLVLAWTIVALTFQVTMLTLNFTNPELATKIGNEIMWKIDGRFNK